jgi:hypothetical protein
VVWTVAAPGHAAVPAGGGSRTYVARARAEFTAAGLAEGLEVGDAHSRGDGGGDRVEDNRRWQELPGALKASVPDVWEMPTAHATSEAR